MRVLNVNMTIDAMAGGGTAERTVQLSRAMAEQGAQVTLLTLDLGLTAQRRSELQGVKLEAWPCLVKRFYLPLPNILKLVKIVKEVDVIHLMGHWTLLNAIVYLVLRVKKKNYIVCPAGALPIFGRSTLIKTIYNKLVGCAIIKNANAHVAVSENEVNGFEQYGVPKQKITFIPNGVDVNKAIAKASSSSNKLTPYILFLGRLNVIKGPDILLDAFVDFFQKNSAYQLVFAGPDEGLKESMLVKIGGSSIKNKIKFVGPVYGQEKQGLLAGADLLVIPSRHDAMSIVVLEAGIFATPVLATNTCGLSDFEKTNCVTIVPADKKSLAIAMEKLLSNKSLLEQQASRLKLEVEKNYSWKIMAKKHLDLILSLK